MRATFYAISAMLGIGFAGCTHHQVIVPIPNPTGDPVQQTHTVSAIKGGKARLVVDCDTNIIDEVSIEPNLFHSLVHVGTLGLISPLEITYQCGKVYSLPVDFDDEE